MRWGDRWGAYTRTQKRPPPEHGIKIKTTGTTWWGQRWIDALEKMSPEYSARLARGRTYARTGRTHDLVIERGGVTAKVTGSRATPYRITISLARLSEPAWKQAIAAMAGKAQFAAELLAGAMPKEIDEAFAAANASLFPRRNADLVTSCSCPDWANPCKHVAATHYVLGEALDRDPFLLFELRGRTKVQVLDALRAARTRGRRSREPGVVAPEIAKVALGTVEASDYDRAREPLPTLHLRFADHPANGAVLRQLGVPGSWSGETSPAELLAPLVHAAAARARELALAEPSEPPAAAEQAQAPATRAQTSGRSRTRSSASRR